EASNGGRWDQGAASALPSHRGILPSLLQVWRKHINTSIRWQETLPKDPSQAREHTFFINFAEEPKDFTPLGSPS
ncbi:MAG: hypothetical protein J2P37_33345, partial [Ktedonobacteraceae bacterium]|nr:hypothetical protein [Ktedonobacteraceae bacterium]